MATSGLVDLLKLSMERRSESLMEEWPHPLDSSLTGHDGVTWTAEEKAAVDIAVLIIRAINAHFDPLDTTLPEIGRSREERRKFEKKIYLLRYSWYNTPDGVTEEVLKLQKQLCQKVLHGHSKITFERLIECGVMAKSFWSRWELLAWSMTENIREEGASEWTRQKITSIPAVNAPTGAAEADGDEAIFEQLAYRSLLRWRWDGETQLADFLTSEVKLEWSSSDGQTHHQGEQAWPDCLRVKYDPRGREDAPRFADLARISMANPRAEEAVHYRLLATVRLGGQGCRDFVRIYDNDCRNARPMSMQAMKLPYVDNDWELGEPDSRYMLYYIACDHESVPGPAPKEVVLHPWLETKLREELKAVRKSALDEGESQPLPYGRITLRSPTEVSADQHGEASDSVGLESPLRAASAGTGSTAHDPRAKTRQRVEETGGDIAECLGFR